jgi:glutaredoxin
VIRNTRAFIAGFFSPAKNQVSCAPFIIRGREAFKRVRKSASCRPWPTDHLHRLPHPPKQEAAPAAAQAQVEAAAKDLTLYQFHACPFCVKTRRTLRRLNVPVALRDAKNNEQDRQALLEQGGKIKVPCLRIEEKRPDYLDV